MRAGNGDTDRKFKLSNGARVMGLGSYHKTLPHDDYGEVDQDAFKKFVKATRGDGSGFKRVEAGDKRPGAKGSAPLTNPQGGLAADRLTRHPASYEMPPAPTVLSRTTAVEMTELYWMALRRDMPFADFDKDPNAELKEAVPELDRLFDEAARDPKDPGRFILGVDIPGSAKARTPLTRQNIFRLGLPGEEVGPMVSQFFLRRVPFGTQTIDQMQRPYRGGNKYNFLTSFEDWLASQRRGKDDKDQTYQKSNEFEKANFEDQPRYISTMRDLARFVHKDALHQAYFNAALILLAGEANWNPGNPYIKGGRLADREAGFGVLGGPHILALVSEVATRALKVVWNQKWQVHLRLRPEAYGGLVHVQNVGPPGKAPRGYGLPDWVHRTAAAEGVKKLYGGFLLPMAFTAGSPTHPAYGAGHATVAGACVTVLKAFFETYDAKSDKPVPFNALLERDQPYGPKKPIDVHMTGKADNNWALVKLPNDVAQQLTIEGELNKLAQNVAMGRSMGGVHWRTDNARSLILGEALAAEILADITRDVNEKPYFEFRTFARNERGQPRKVRIENGLIFVDGVLATIPGGLS